MDDAASQYDAEAIGRAAAQLALERKARDVKLLFVGDRLGIAEYFVLATVNNRRQARAVRDAVRLGLKALGVGVPSAASEDPDGRWSLYDYGGVVLHMFDDEGRQYFDLDSLWADVPGLVVAEGIPTDAPLTGRSARLPDDGFDDDAFEADDDADDDSDDSDSDDADDDSDDSDGAWDIDDDDVSEDEFGDAEEGTR